MSVYNKMDSLKDGLSAIGNTISGLDNKTIIAGAVGAAAVGAVVGASVYGITKAKKKSSKTSKGRSRDRKFISKQKHERAYQRRRKRQKKKTYGKHYKTKRSGIKYTKNGQPYIILKSGKARFIKGKRKR